VPIPAETDGELEPHSLLGKGPFAAWDAGPDDATSFPALGGPAAMDQFLEAIRCARCIVSCASVLRLAQSTPPHIWRL